MRSDFMKTKKDYSSPELEYVKFTFTSVIMDQIYDSSPEGERPTGGVDLGDEDL